MTGRDDRLERTPLVRLASDVRTLHSARQPGDATLVVRDTLLDGRHVIDGAVYGGYDLYTDAGNYYYAPDSLAELQQTFDDHEVVSDSGDEAKALDTIAAAATATPARARAAVLSTQPRADPAEGRRLWLMHIRTLPPRQRRRQLRLLDTPPTREQQIESADSLVWIDATQALEVGAGRPDVRAGAMKALSTLQHVTQTPTRVAGRRALRVRFPQTGGAETIWLDAATGVPIEEQDGPTSHTGFEVERVTAARLPTAISPQAQLR